MNKADETVVIPVEWVHGLLLGDRRHHNAIRELVDNRTTKSTPDGEAVALTVWYGSMPETNGKANWTAILHKGDIYSGFTIARSEYPDRVRYEADRVRFLIGEIKEEPFILDYDGDLHSGYTRPAPDARLIKASRKLLRHVDGNNVALETIYGEFVQALKAHEQGAGVPLDAALEMAYANGWNACNESHSSTAPDARLMEALEELDKALVKDPTVQPNGPIMDALRKVRAALAAAGKESQQCGLCDEVGHSSNNCPHREGFEQWPKEKQAATKQVTDS